MTSDEELKYIMENCAGYLFMARPKNGVPYKVTGAQIARELLLARQQLKELEDKYDKLHGLSVYWEKDEAKKNLEIDRLKTEIGEWREDSERLNYFSDHSASCAHWLYVSSCDCGFCECRERHRALLEKYGKEKK